MEMEERIEESFEKLNGAEPAESIVAVEVAGPHKVTPADEEKAGDEITVEENITIEAEPSDEMIEMTASESTDNNEESKDLAHENVQDLADDLPTNTLDETPKIVDAKENVTGDKIDDDVIIEADKSAAIDCSSPTKSCEITIISGTTEGEDDDEDDEDEEIEDDEDEDEEDIISEELEDDDEEEEELRDDEMESETLEINDEQEEDYDQDEEEENDGEGPVSIDDDSERSNSESDSESQNPDASDGEAAEQQDEDMPNGNENKSKNATHQQFVNRFRKRSVKW